jgi:hypothetical protein
VNQRKVSLAHLSRHQPDRSAKMKRIYLRVIAYTLSVVLLYPAFAVVSQTNTGSLSGIESRKSKFAASALQ